MQPLLLRHLPQLPSLLPPHRQYPLRLLWPLRPHRHLPRLPLLHPQPLVLPTSPLPCPATFWTSACPSVRPSLPVVAPAAGTVKEIRVKKGDVVNTDDVLVVLG